MHHIRSPYLLTLILFCVGLCLSFPVLGASKVTARDFLKQSAEWFKSEEGRKILENVLSWQSDEGSWPKNTNTTARLYNSDRKSLHGTFDNGATIPELHLMAKGYAATGDIRFKAAAEKAITHILKAQYPTGGWPQYYPPGKQYHRHITFNDDSMIRILECIRSVAYSAEFSLISEDSRKRAAAAFDRGVQCILKCQIRVKGVLTVWCAQHDEIDLSPRPARTFELVSLSGAESAKILMFLMSLEKPSPSIIEAVDAGVAWFERSKIIGLRQDKVDGNKVMVKDPNAPVLWARFYDIESNRPFFSGRDGIKKWDISEIESERRNGYSWYGAYAEQLLASYPKWKASLKN